MVPVGFIGAGNMAQAIITGVINRGLYKPEDILIYEVNPERAEYITRTLRVRSTDSHRELLEQVPIVVLAVKPGTVKAVLGEIRDYAAGRLIISIAAGVTLRRAEATFTGCTFRGNAADQPGASGGAMVDNGSTAFFFDSRFEDNHAIKDGGGLAAQTGYSRPGVLRRCALAG